MDASTSVLDGPQILPVNATVAPAPGDWKRFIPLIAALALVAVVLYAMRSRSKKS